MECCLSRGYQRGAHCSTRALVPQLVPVISHPFHVLNIAHVCLFVTTIIYSSSCLTNIIYQLKFIVGTGDTVANNTNIVLVLIQCIVQ